MLSHNTSFGFTDACSVPDLIKNSNIGVGCIAALTKSTEETRNFKYFWDILNAANDSVHTPYIYVKPDKSRDISLHGKFNLLIII